VPKDDLFSSDDPVGVYQVWHRVGKEFRHVADVPGNYMGAIVSTGMVARDHPLAQHVIWLVDQARPTTLGDKIVDPLGHAYELYDHKEFGPALRKAESPQYNPQPQPGGDKSRGGLTR
jgi:hypothetical protein